MVNLPEIPIRIFEEFEVGNGKNYLHPRKSPVLFARSVNILVRMARFRPEKKQAPKGTSASLGIPLQPEHSDSHYCIVYIFGHTNQDATLGVTFSLFRIPPNQILTCIFGATPLHVLCFCRGFQEATELPDVMDIANSEP